MYILLPKKIHLYFSQITDVHLAADLKKKKTIIILNNNFKSLWFKLLLIHFHLPIWYSSNLFYFLRFCFLHYRCDHYTGILKGILLRLNTFWWWWQWFMSIYIMYSEIAMAKVDDEHWSPERKNMVTEEKEREGNIM